MTVNVIVVVPELPSATLASSIERRGFVVVERAGNRPEDRRAVVRPRRGRAREDHRSEQREGQDEKRGQRSASMKSLR